jgi:large repetitive protein
VTFTAQVTPDSANTPIPPPYPGSAAPVTGTVSFADAAGPICSAPVALVSGLYVASCATASLQAVNSPHTIVATYNGNSNYLGSNNSVKQMVNPAKSNTSLATSLNPSVVRNQNNHNDTVTFTAMVTPIAGPVTLSGSITFSDNGNLIPECATPVPVIPATGIATCTTMSLGFGSHTILAVYGNDGNFLSSNGTVSQSVQDYGLTASPTAPVSVTQGYTSVTDLFTPQVTPSGANSLTVTAVPISGFTGTLTLSCAPPVPITALSGAVPPACILGSQTVTISGTGSQTPVTIVIDATSASTTPGAYSVTVTGVDSTTGLIRISAPFIVYVRAKTAPITIVSGATTGNTTNADFILPANVSLTDLMCTSVGGPTLAAKVAPAGLSIGCTFSPNSVPSTTTIQSATVAVTISTNGTALTQLVTNTGIFAASLVGIPILALLAFLRGKKSSRSTFFRYLGVLFIAAVITQAIGCGGHFTRTATNTGLTPPGTYLILVQGTGSDGLTYDAVIQVDVTR